MISQSRINCYINCSQKYFYKYVKNYEPSNITKIDGLLLGNLIHSQIENHIKKTEKSYIDIFKDIILSYSKNKIFIENIEYPFLEREIKKTETETEIKTLLNSVLKDEFQNIVNDTTEQLKTKTNMYFSIFETAKIVGNFVITEIENGLFRDIIKYESETQITTENIQGFTDIIGITKDFEKVIIDFKTTKSDYEFKKRLQDKLYCYIIYKTTGEIPIFRYIAIKYINKNEILTEISQMDFRYSEDEIMEIEDIIENFQRGIKNNVFLKNENSFLCSKDFCEYFNICQGVENEI